MKVTLLYSKSRCNKHLRTKRGQRMAVGTITARMMIRAMAMKMTKKKLNNTKDSLISSCNKLKNQRVITDWVTMKAAVEVTTKG